MRAIYLPVGGERALRRDAIQRIGVAPFDRVLELGCGTGSFTRLLLDKGADVTSVDGSERMLARARVRAPGARFERRDLRSFCAPAKQTFDVVFFGFVLHELAKPARAALFAQALACLAPGGRVVIVDHAVPAGSGFAKGWRRFLTALEPAPVREVLTEGYERELHDAGLVVLDRQPLGRGTAQLVVARKASL